MDTTLMSYINRNRCMMSYYFEIQSNEKVKIRYTKSILSQLDPVEVFSDYEFQTINL